MNTLAEVLKKIDAITLDPQYIRLKNKNRTKNEIQTFGRMKRNLSRLQDTKAQLEKSIPTADRRKEAIDATAHPKPKHRTPPKIDNKTAKRPNWRNQPKKVAWRNQGEINESRNDYARDESKESEYRQRFKQYELDPTGKTPIRSTSSTTRTRKPKITIISDEEAAQIKAKRDAKQRTDLRRRQLDHKNRQASSATVVQKPVVKHNVVVITKYRPDPSESLPKQTITIAKPAKAPVKKNRLPTATKRPRSLRGDNKKNPKRSTPKPHPLEAKLRAPLLPPDDEIIDNELIGGQSDTDNSQVELVLSEKTSEKISEKTSEKISEKAVAKKAPRRRAPRANNPSIVPAPKRPEQTKPPQDSYQNGFQFDSYEDDLDNVNDSASDLDASDIEY